jgi:hypothetical protein
MKRYLTLVLILATLSSYSQQGKVIIRFCPLALVDNISFPTIQGGVEYGLVKKLSWYNEFGIKYRSSAFEGADTSHVKSSGFKVKTEFRYYFTKNSEDQDSRNPVGYLGLNLFYVKDWHNTNVGYYKNNDTALYRIDNLGVRKNIYGLNAIAGIQLHFPKIEHFLFEAYAGIGIRFSNVDNVNQEYDPDKDEMLHPVDVSIQAVKNSIDTDQGFHTNFNLTCGFRLCYRF